MCTFHIHNILKKGTFTNKIHTVDELKTAVEYEMRLIITEMVQKMMANSTEWINQCISRNRDHTNDIP